MSVQKLEENFQAPGDVLIKQIYIVTSKGMVVDMRDYLIEIDLYESIFTPCVTGTFLVKDSRNLLKNLPLLGEELLVLEFKTPTIDDRLSIHKTFRIHSIKNRNYASDGSSQIYSLDFCSVEMFRDISNNISRSFSGNPSEIVVKIFQEYLACSRNIDVETLNESDVKTDLTILNTPDNVIKFVSPNWTPIQCINWLCSKSYSSKACNFLFWETTKGFYYGSTDSIYKFKDKVTIGNYVYSSSLPGNVGSDDANKRLFTIKYLMFLKNTNQLANNLDGYISNQLLDINLYNKSYEEINYDHITNFTKYSHTENTKSFPMADLNTSRSFSSYSKLNYNYPKLHNIEENFPEVTKYIFGNRRSNMLELDNLKVKIGIPGRTDIEVGNLINIRLPKASPSFPEDKSSVMYDELYSGSYLITSLNHKINPLTHFITCELTKDCFSRDHYYGKR